NVWEWCWDWWRENIPSDTPAEGVPSGSLRSLRGGSW
ncbi:SUMF1/EgtB/PvdO family nonheme iron enzyme, partial [uncultured Treponema sp.]